MLETKRPAPAGTGNRASNKPNHERPNHTGLALDLQGLARDVRRIGCGYRADPETILLQKDAIATRLNSLARAVGGAHG